jgi:hypothetical protein
MAKAKRSLTDRVASPVIKSNEVSAEAQEQALNKLISPKPVKAQKKIRVSVDFPTDLYERMKADTEANGQTHRGFIVSLVREYYNK